MYYFWCRQRIAAVFYVVVQLHDALKYTNERIFSEYIDTNSSRDIETETDLISPKH